MSDRKYPIITISREYGAGGRSIAREVAKRLDIPFYDRDFVKETASKSGYSVEDIEREGEEISSFSKLMNDLLNNVTIYKSSHDAIFLAQVETILHLASRDCIIIGRCANIILREAGIPSLDVFLYADVKDRAHRALELNTYGDEDLQKYIAKRDERRATYYKTYTGHTLGDCHDYDISLNTGVLGYQTCADIIADLAANPHGRSLAAKNEA